MTLQDLLAEAAQSLRDAGVEEPLRDARVILAHLAGRPVSSLSDPLDHALVAGFRAAIGQRRQFRPVAQIIGQREFWGRTFAVTSDVLDPRPETETLIALALAGHPAGRLLDLGTGSGILALTLLAEWTQARAVAVDVSPAALAVAGTNAERLGVSDRVRLVTGNWFSELEGSFDLVVSNPPYIADALIATLAPDVREWEPRLALSGGADGLVAYRSIASGLAVHLVAGGRALFEIGYDQAAAVRAIFEAAGPFTVAIHRDMGGHNRVAEVTYRA